MPASDARNKEYAVRHRLPFRQRWVVRVVSGSIFGYPAALLDRFFSTYSRANAAIKEFENG